MYGLSPEIIPLSQIIVYELKKVYIRDKIFINLDLYPIRGIDIEDIIILNSKFNSYDHANSGIDSVTKRYTSIIKLNLDNLYVDSIIHELKHAYVDNKMFLNKGVQIKHLNEIRQFYTDDLEKLLTVDRKEFPSLLNIILMYYYTSDLEVPSFLENHNFNPKFINYKDRIKNILELKYRDINHKQASIEFDKLRQYNIPEFNKYSTYDDFINRSIPILRKKGLNILKKINRIDYEMLKNVKNL